MRRRLVLEIAIGVLVCLGSRDAFAQGHGHAYGHAHQGGVTGGSGGSTPLPASGAGIRNFGVWLDDASVAAPGGGWVSLSFNYYRSDLFNEIDVPVADAGVGLARNVQFGFTVPYYNLRDTGGGTVHGLGDLYLHSKVRLRDPSTSTSGFGWAVVPIVEVLSASAVAGRSRVNWALPVSVELQRRGWRAYGAGGYFSRGSLFASGALEKPLSERVALTGTLSHSFSIHQTTAGLTRVRTDVGGGGSYLLKPGVILFGSLGRTLSSNDPERTRLSLSAGMSFSVAAPPRTTR